MHGEAFRAQHDGRSLKAKQHANEDTIEQFVGEVTFTNIELERNAEINLYRPPTSDVLGHD